MKERMPACALNRLLACALRPVAVQNGNRLGRLRPSRPIGSFARTMTPRAVAQRVQALDPGHVVHQAEGVAVDVEPAAVQPRPCRHAGAHEPALEARVAPFAVRRVDRIVAAVARIELPQQCADDRGLVLLHQIPQRHVDRHAVGLDLRDRLGAVIRPVQHARDVGRRQSRAPTQLRAQQQRRHAHVFFAVIENCLVAVARANGPRRCPSAIVSLSMRSQPSMP